MGIEWEAGSKTVEGRTIKYEVRGGFRGIKWKYRGEAWDVETGIRFKTDHYYSSDTAEEKAINGVIQKLSASGILPSTAEQAPSTPATPHPTVSATTLSPVIAESPAIEGDSTHFSGEQLSFNPYITAAVCGVVVIVLFLAFKLSGRSIASIRPRKPVTITTPLDIRDLSAIQDAVDEVTKWESLGLKLGLIKPTLEKIAQDNIGVECRKREMLTAWLNGTDSAKPTWNSLIAAVKKINKRLAAKIEKEEPWKPDKKNS